VGIAEDVTRQKQAEEQNRKLQQAVEQSPVSIMITDCAGIIEYVNPKFTQLTGYSYGEAVGQNSRILKSGKTSDDIYQQMWKSIAAGVEWHGELLNKKKNGEFYWASASLSPIKNTDGMITHYLGVNEDITERKQAEEALKEQEHLLRVIIDSMPAGVAHIGPDLHYLLVNRQYEEWFGKTIDRLLGRHVREVIGEDAWEIARPNIEQVQTGKAATYVHQRPTAVGGFRWLQVSQVPFDDPAGKSSSYISHITDITEIKEVEEMLCLAKKKAESATRAKSRFLANMSHEIRTPMNGVIGMTDLLLGTELDQNQREYAEIIKMSGNNLLQLINGILDHSEEGSFARTTPASPGRQLPSVATTRRNCHILLAEDDSVNQVVVQGFLTQLGYSVDIVENGCEALQFLAEYDYQLVLMDCQMPEMDGLEATAIIRDPGSHVRNHALPIIALTAYALKGDRDRCLAAGMDDCLTKPLDIDSLSTLLDKWLTTSTSSGLNIFDEAGFLKRHQGNEAMAREIVQLFVAKAPRYVAVLQENLDAGDHLGVQRQAHSIKGASATLGADRLTTLAAEIVALVEGNELDKANQAAWQLAREYESLLTVLADRGWIASE